MKLFFILTAGMILSCNSTKNNNTPSTSTSTSSSEVSTTAQSTSGLDDSENTEVSNAQKDMLIGKFQKQELEQQPFKEWFTPAYDEFNPDEEAMQVIKDHINDYDITLLMGTWCGDSKRETPKFLKILEEANYDDENLEMVAVDRDKKSPLNVEEELDVLRVPTIVFSKNGKEVNRFVEYAQGNSIEDDIAKIVSGQPYKNSYAD